MNLINCTGDVVVGDKITFSEGVFSGGSFGRFRKTARFLGERTICAIVLKESYGEKKQQHTFTLKVVESTGYAPLSPDEIILRKGRNIYKNGTVREVWENEQERQLLIHEKHCRGDKARFARDQRRASNGL